MFNGIFHVPAPVNEPVLNYAPGSPERASLKKRLDEMLTELETADPAEAPEIADAIASDLSEMLETDDGDEPETPSRH